MQTRKAAEASTSSRSFSSRSGLLLSITMMRSAERRRSACRRGSYASTASDPRRKRNFAGIASLLMMTARRPIAGRNWWRAISHPSPSPSALMCVVSTIRDAERSRRASGAQSTRLMTGASPISTQPPRPVFRGVADVGPPVPIDATGLLGGHGAHHLSRNPEDDRARRHIKSFADDGPGADDAATSDLRSRQDDGSDADEAVISDVGGMYDGAMADRDAIAHLGRHAVFDV